MIPLVSWVFHSGIGGLLWAYSGWNAVFSNVVLRLFIGGMTNFPVSGNYW